MDDYTPIPLVPEEREPDRLTVALWWAATRGGDYLDLANADTVLITKPAGV